MKHGDTKHAPYDDEPGAVARGLVPTPEPVPYLSRRTIETLLTCERDEARGQRDHARFMAAGWRRLAARTFDMFEEWTSTRDAVSRRAERVDAANEAEATCTLPASELRTLFVERDVFAAYAVRLYRELDRAQGGGMARTIMADLLAEVPSVAEGLTLREQEQIAKGEGWK